MDEDNYGVVVVYECGNKPHQELHQEVVPLKYNFGTVKGWNEMMSKLKHGDPNKDIIILYTHELVM